MKRLILKRICLITVFVFLFACLSACNSNSGGNNNGTPDAASLLSDGGTATTGGEDAPLPDADESGDADNINADNPDEDNTDPYAGKTTLTYIGHASIKIVSSQGTVIYIDPNYDDVGVDYSAEADYIFVTHGHDDHTPNKKVVLKETGTMVTHKEALHDGTYETFDFGEVKAEAVPAGGNPNHDIKYCVGYLITVDGITFYHAGDTSMIEEMNNLSGCEIDYAFYPIDGQFNMDAAEATEVANLVGAKNNIPIHEFDDHQYFENAEKKSDQFLPDGRLVLDYGETIIVKE